MSTNSVILLCLKVEPNCISQAINNTVSIFWDDIMAGLPHTWLSAQSLLQLEVPDAFGLRALPFPFALVCGHSPPSLTTGVVSIPRALVNLVSVVCGDVGGD